MLKELTEKIIGWHYARNLIHGSTDKQQFKKLLEELMEMHDSIVLRDSPIDDIGDMYVVLCNLAERNGLTMRECAESSQFYELEQRNFNASFDSIQADTMRLRESIVMHKSLKSDIGDIVVELKQFAIHHGLTFEECVACAWKDIEHRTGQMVDGIFVKDSPEPVHGLKREAKIDTTRASAVLPVECVELDRDLVNDGDVLSIEFANHCGGEIPTLIFGLSHRANRMRILLSLDEMRALISAAEPVHGLKHDSSFKHTPESTELLSGDEASGD